MPRRGEKRRKRQQRHFRGLRKLKAQVKSLQQSRQSEGDRRPKPTISRLIVQVVVSVSGLFLSTLVGNMLNDFSPFWAFIFVVLAVCIFFGYWAWVLAGLFTKRRVLRITGIVAVAIGAIMSAPVYANALVHSQGVIEMPTFVDDSTQVSVYYGNRPNPVARTQTTIGDLRNNPETALRITIGNNDQTIFYVHIEGNRLYVDTQLFAGIADPTKHIFNPPVFIKDNAFSGKPPGWKVYQNNANLEIDDRQGLPVLLMEYKSPYKIIIAGLFVTPMGICKVDNSAKDAIFIMEDSLQQLGTYRVDNVFPHSVFDLFRSERVYALQNYSGE